MNKATYYQTDFKPDYELFQQKVSELSKQKGKITKNDINLQKLKNELELIKEQIEDQGLEFGNNSIFFNYASIQQLTQKKKSASDCCMHCGEQMKKIIQCEFCAQLYCKNCCWRRRVIPFEQHSDFRLCCQQCHQKYIKHFNNQQFYKQKGIYLAAIDELERKYEKTKAKYQKKQNQMKEYRQQKRGLKIKQNNLKKALLEQEKAIKYLSQQYEKAIQHRAQQLLKSQQQYVQQQQRKIQNSQLQKERQLLQERRQIQQQRRIKQLEEQKMRILETSRIKEEELARREAEMLKEKEELQREKRELTEKRMKKVQQEERDSYSPGSVVVTPQKSPISMFQPVQQIDCPKPQQSPTSYNTQKQYTNNIDETPRRVVFNQDWDFDAILKSEEIKVQQQEHNLVVEEKQQDQNNQKHQKKQHEVTLKQFLKEIKQSQLVEQAKPTKKVVEQNKVQEQSPMTIVQKKQEEKESESEGKSKNSLVKESPKLTMNQIKTMSMNDLLSMKIPINPGVGSQPPRPRKSSHPEVKTDAQQNSTTTQNERMYNSLLEPYVPQSSLCGLSLPVAQTSNRESVQKQQILLRQSIKSVHEEEQQDYEKETNKRALLRQSLISSTNKASLMAQQKAPVENDQQTAMMGEPQKCTCEIM